MKYGTDMPSALPRVTVYLKPETRAALDAASEVLGQSRSRLVAELLDASVPVLRAITDAGRVVASAGDMQRKALQATADELAPMKVASEELQGQLLDIMGRIAGEDGPDPRPSNTGVRN